MKMITIEEVYEKFTNNAYHNKVKYPSKPIRKCPKCGEVFKEGQKFCSECGVVVAELYEKAMVEYKKMLEEYQKEDLRTYHEFVKDALISTGLVDHKNAQKAFDYAWDKGHSIGYQEVFNELIEIARLIL